MQRRHDPYAALRHRDYRLFLSGHVLTIIGAQMQAVAVGWELYERTNSAWALGLVGFIQFLPVVVLAIPVGHVVDRWNRRRLLIAGQVVMAAASLGLAFLSFTHGPLFLAYACLLLTGISNSLGMTVRSSILSALVPREQLSNAITWNSTGRQVATVIGPALGGFLIAWTGGAAWAYLSDAVLALIFVALILLIRAREAPRKIEPASVHSLLAGLRFIRRRKLILSTITLDMLAVLFGGAITLLPIFARDILHVGPEGLGWLRAAPSVGSILMAFAIAHLPLLKRAGPAILWAVAGYGAVTVIFGVSTNIYLSLAMLALAGAFDAMSVVIRHSLIQIMTPDTMRGRVAAVNSVFGSASNELGGFESGVAAALLGPVMAVVIGGLASIASVMGVLAVWPEILRLKSLHDVEVTAEEQATLEKALPS